MKLVRINSDALVNPESIDWIEHTDFAVSLHIGDRSFISDYPLEVLMVKLSGEGTMPTTVSTPLPVMDVNPHKTDLAY